MGNADSRRKASKLRERQIRDKIPKLPGPQENLPRFVADVMLGKLAKWLRIAGYDVLYSNRYTDDALISISRNEDRILLSLDTRLLVRRNVDRFLFLQSRDLEGQLRQILETFRPSGFPAPLSRCLSCNEILSDVPAESVRSRVPEYVFRHQRSFKICPGCRKIFWSGTHRNSVLKILQGLLQEGVQSAQPEESERKKSPAGRVPDPEEFPPHVDTYPKR